MKRLFLDTNFILDYLVRDEYKLVSQEFLAEAARQSYKFFVSYLSVANFAYIERKVSRAELLGYLHSILEIFEIIPNNRKQLKDSLTVEAADFEDVLQYQAAISSKCDFIITRNEQDFNFSEIPVFSPSEFMKIITDTEN